ncbi:MAG: hypothetical protein ACYC25_07810 [Paludibacter sp.]
MIWLDLKQMERKLSTNDISEKETLNYYLAFFIIVSVYVILATFLRTLINVKDVSTSTSLIQVILNTVIKVIGILYVYHINSKRNNKDFFLRFFSVSFVIFIRLIIYTLSIGFIVLILIYLFIDIKALSSNYSIYIFQLFQIVFYILIGLSFKRINALNQENNGN